MSLPWLFNLPECDLLQNDGDDESASAPAACLRNYGGDVGHHVHTDHIPQTCDDHQQRGRAHHSGMLVEGRRPWHQVPSQHANLHPKLQAELLWHHPVLVQLHVAATQGACGGLARPWGHGSGSDAMQILCVGCKGRWLLPSRSRATVETRPVLGLPAARYTCQHWIRRICEKTWWSIHGRTSLAVPLHLPQKSDRRSYTNWRFIMRLLRLELWKLRSISGRLCRLQ